MADGSTVLSIRERIDEAIAKSAERIQNAAHDHLVEAEVSRRTQVFLSGLNALREAEADLRKFQRPDNVLYGEDGQPMQSLYTKGRLDEIKKHKERAQRLETLMNKALETNANDDWKKLEDGIKKGGKGGSADE